MRTILVMLLSAGLLGSTGCDSDGGPVRDGGTLALSVSRVAGGILIANDTDDSLAYAVWNRDWLGLFAPCMDRSDDCLRLGPNASVEIADADVIGYSPGMREAVVRVWRVMPDGAGGYQAADLEEFIVPRPDRQ